MTATDFEFTFVDSPPPASRGRNAMYAAFREALQSRPGEWAIYPRKFESKASAQGTTANINHGRMPTFQQGCYEARTSELTVYVRYLGGES